MALVLRQTVRGIVLDAPAPEQHAWGLSWLLSGIASGLADVRVTVHTADGDLTYRMTGFEKPDTYEFVLEDSAVEGDS